MSEDLFNITNFYDYDYHCNNPEKFKKLIYNLENGMGPDILNEYLKFNGLLTDVCFMKQYGNGEIYIAWIGKAIINGGNLETLKKFIELDKEQINSGDHHYNLLSYAIIMNYEMAYFLLDQGADVNIFGHRNKTPLYYAILEKNVDMVNKLIQLGANPNYTYSMMNANYLYHAINLYTYIIDNNDNKKNLHKIIKILMNAGAIIQEKLLNKKEIELINNI